MLLTDSILLSKSLNFLIALLRGGTKTKMFIFINCFVKNELIIVIIKMFLKEFIMVHNMDLYIVIKD